MYATNYSPYIVADINFLKRARPQFSAYRQTSTQLVIKIFAVASTVAIAATIAAMGGLVLYYRFQLERLAEVNAERRIIEDDLRPELVNRLVSVDQLLASVRERLAVHVHGSNILTWLESNLHSNIHVSNAELSHESRELSMGLVMPTYLTVSEQIKLFEASPAVEKVSFEAPTAAEDTIQFRVTLTFKPEIFKRQ